jgi:hypothetical protein
MRPIVGRQIRSADAITGAAGTVSDVAIASISEGKTILTLPRRTGPDRVALLRRTASLAGRAEKQIAGVNLGPSKGLLGRLSRARTEFSEELTSLRATLHAAASGAVAAADLLDGPRRTLVFAANNAEMRAGSGMFLAVGELATSHGALRLDRMFPVAQVPIPRGIPVEGDLKARWGWANPSRDWTSLMMSPDFSTSAPLAARMWKAARKSTVDGVISIDPAGLRALLSATGPVTVDGRRITASNVEQELLHDQYERFPTRQTGARRESLAQIPGAVMSALNAGRWDPATLMSGLAAAARGRHVMLWSARRSEEAAWLAAGVGGRLSNSSLMVSVLNRGGNKLDWFLRVNATLEFARGATGAEGVVRITVKNATPRGEPSYIAGPGEDTGGKEGDYVGILAVSLPGFSGGGRIEGVRALGIVGGDGPTRVVGIPFILARGSTRVFVVRFQLVDRTGSVRVEPSARIPTIRWVSGQDHWQDDSARVVSWELSRSSH